MRFSWMVLYLYVKKMIKTSFFCNIKSWGTVGILKNHRKAFHTCFTKNSRSFYMEKEKIEILDFEKSQKVRFKQS